MLRRSSVLRTLGGAALFGGLVALTAYLGSRATNPQRDPWYQALQKPALQPPPAAFPVAWTLLYTLIAISAVRVYNRPAGPARRRALGLWFLQLGLNAAWSPLFFAMHRPKLALADLVALIAATAAYTAAARKVDPKAPALMAPYLAWLVFAGYLNAEILRLNPGLTEGRG